MDFSLKTVSKFQLEKCCQTNNWKFFLTGKLRLCVNAQYWKFQTLPVEKLSFWCRFNDMIQQDTPLYTPDYTLPRHYSNDYRLFSITCFLMVPVCIRCHSRFFVRVGMKPHIPLMRPSKVINDLLKDYKIRNFSVLKFGGIFLNFFFFEKYWTGRPTFTSEKFWFFISLIF